MAYVTVFKTVFTRLLIFASNIPKSAGIYSTVLANFIRGKQRFKKGTNR
jgi:hypothetical protein